MSQSCCEIAAIDVVDEDRRSDQYGERPARARRARHRSGGLNRGRHHAFPMSIPPIAITILVPRSMIAPLLDFNAGGAERAADRLGYPIRARREWRRGATRAGTPERQGPARRRCTFRLRQARMPTTSEARHRLR